jgi:DNA-binding MarR family transcriptional regulator
MSKGRNLSPEDEMIILNAIADGGDAGKDRNQIASITGMDGSTLHYRLGILEKNMQIVRVPGTRPVLYTIVYKGRQRLADLRNSRNVVGIELLNQNDRLICLQKYELKYPIETMPPIFYPSMNVQMTNWVQGISDWKNCCEVINGEKSVVIKVKKLVGENEYQLELMARDIADAHVKMMEQVWGFKFGLPVKVGKPEFELKNAIAKKELDEYGWVPGVRDRSEFGGEYVFDGADPLASFKNVPREVRALWNEVRVQGQIIKQQRESIDAVHVKLDDMGKGFLELVSLIRIASEIKEEMDHAAIKPSDGTGQEVA